MVVKAKRGRRRYIAFEAPPGVWTEDRLQLMLKEEGVRRSLRPLKLIQFDGTRGIVRCMHLDKEGTLSLLSSFDSKMRTLATSGTLKALRTRYFKVKEARPPSP
jgi:RNase P/RNase MRP subunit POP5